VKKKFKNGGLLFIIMGINSEIFHQKTQKNRKRMKKLFIVLAVVSLGFVACNNEGEKKTDPPADTVVTPTTTDTMPPAPPAADTSVKKDTNAAAPAK
jgi:hypothetical protein